MAGRVTRFFRETFGVGAPLARVSRFFREVFAEGAPTARVSRLFRETFGEGAPAARATRFFRETFAEGAPAARVTRGPFREIFADNPILLIASFRGTDGDEDPTSVQFVDDTFDYDVDPQLILLAGTPFIFEIEDDGTRPEIDGFDYDQESARAFRRSQIHARAFAIT